MDDLIALFKHGGPIAIAVLALSALAIVWGKLQILRKFYEGDPGNEKTPEKPGRLREERVAAQVREDEIRDDYDGRLTDQRKHYEDLMAKERAEVKALYRELNSTIKRLGGDEEGGARESDTG